MFYGFFISVRKFLANKFNKKSYIKDVMQVDKMLLIIKDKN